MIVLDTNVLSALMRRQQDERVVTWLDRQPRISVWTTSITVLEIRFGIAVMPVEAKRTQLGQAFERMLGEIMQARVVPFDTAAAEAAASLMAGRRQSGHSGDLRDSMIAGIVIARHATLATRNIRHFDDLPVSVINPWAG